MNNDLFESCMALMKQNQSIDSVFDLMIEWAKAGKSTDGAHHKLWYLKELEEIINEALADPVVIGDGFNCPP